MLLADSMPPRLRWIPGHFDRVEINVAPMRTTSGTPSAQKAHIMNSRVQEEPGGRLYKLGRDVYAADVI